MTNRVKRSRSFASDNNAGVHPKIMEAIAAANDGHVIAYGDDPYTARAVKLFHRELGKETEVFFLFLAAPAQMFWGSKQLLPLITRSFVRIRPT